jgi:hypothetical protein
MPLPGGPTDKLGNRYELWWTVSELVRMLHGQAESIRIEDPGVTKAEFVVVSEGRRVLHQAKRSHQDGKWSLASLASSDVQLLQGMFTELSGNDARFVFVSGSDARELAELADRARQAPTPDEFELQFIGGKEQKANFDKLRKHWKNADAATAYEMLQRIEVGPLMSGASKNRCSGVCAHCFSQTPIQFVPNCGASQKIPSTKPSRAKHSSRVFANAALRSVVSPSWTRQPPSSARLRSAISPLREGSSYGTR